MKQAIAIIHNKGNDTPWLKDLLASIKTDYPVFLTDHEGWCMPGIKHAFDTTDYDEIVFMNDSMVVKDNKIWDIIFKENAGKSVAMSEDYLMFFGKFLRKYYEQTDFPIVTSKLEDVMLGEGKWVKDYMKADPDYVLIQPMKDGDRFVIKHGRTNMKLENDYFIKYKGSWNLDKVLEADPI